MRKCSPCDKDCPDRVAEPVNCHTYCDKYLAFLKQNEEEKKRIFREKMIDNQLNRMEGNRINQNRTGNKQLALRRTPKKQGRRGI